MCDVIVGSIVNGIREPNIYSCALDKPPDYEINKVPESNFLKR